MESKEVVIDTNFFMVPFQFNVDIIDELGKDGVVVCAAGIIIDLQL